MHPEEIELHDWIAGELNAERHAAVAGHVLTCADCRARADDLRATARHVVASLRSLDAPVPVIAFAQVQARAASSRPVWMRVAATVIITLSLSGVAVAAVRGPLFTWVSAAARMFTSSPVRTEAVAAPASRAPVPDAAGVAVRVGRSMSVSFTHAQTQGQLHIVMVDDSALQVTGQSGAARFSSARGTLLVDNSGSTASFDVRIPRNAEHVEIRVADRLVYRKAGLRVDPARPADSNGVMRISLGAVNAVSQPKP